VHDPVRPQRCFASRTQSPAARQLAPRHHEPGGVNAGAAAGRRFAPAGGIRHVAEMLTTLLRDQPKEAPKLLL